MVSERRQVRLVVGAILETEVQVRGWLPHGVVVLLVHRKREHVGLVGEYDRRAVPVVHIQVDHRRTPDCAVAAQHFDCDRHVVDQAEPLAVIGRRVMKAAT